MMITMIYTLKKDGFQAQIDSLGAQLISLTDNEGIEYIWQRKEPYWQRCAPVLFPAVGRNRDGILTIAGKDYPMPQVHGFAHSMEFEMVKQTEECICFRLTDNPETKRQYPFSFQLEITHSLTENGTLYTEFEVQNSGNTEMYFGIGGHPGINCPLIEGERFEDYELDFGKLITVDSLCVTPNSEILPHKQKRVLKEEQTLSLTRTLFDEDALIFENPPFDNLFFRSKKSGRGVRFSFENFTTFALWTEALPAEAPFLCLEPWNSMGKRKGEGTELVQKAGIISLPAGETFHCGYQIQPLLV